MRIAIVAFLILSQTSFACRCLFKEGEALINNPISAMTAVTGVVEAVGEIQRLRVERSWKKKVEFIPLGSVQSSCSLGLTVGKRYLLLSAIEFEKAPANMCQAFAKELGSAQNILARLPE